MKSVLVRPEIAAAVVVVLCLLGLLALAPATLPLNCDMECGEALLSLRAAHQFRDYGIDYGLLENLGTHEEPSIYTHNVNIGTLTFVGLEALGVADSYKFLLPLAAFGLGLAYVYLAVRRMSGNDLLALVTLVLFAATYWGLGAYALNALRSWHLLAFFAVIHHSCGVARLGWSSKEIAGLCVGTIAAFGCGYDFWIICAAVALLVGFANLNAYSLRRTVVLAFGLGAVFALPFVLRQLHVIWAMSLSYWAQDFVYSVAIKVPYATDFIDIPSLDVIDAYYRDRHVLRPPAQPSNNAAQIFFTFQHMIKSVTVPRWGLVSLLTLAGVLAVVVLPSVWRSPLARYIRILIVPATLGVVIGLVIFVPFSLHVYFKHEFPLIAFVLLLAKGVAVYFFISIILASQAVWKIAMASAVVLIFAVDMAMVHWNNSTYGPVLNYNWGKVFAQHSKDRIALTTYKLIPVADSYIGIDASRAVYRTPEQMLEGPTDARYWVYQPGDRFVDFDSPVPLCRWVDWISQLANWRKPQQAGVSCIYDQPLPANATRQSSVADIIRASAGKYDVVEYDNSTNGYVILQRKDQ
ncbi:hypothetical protein [Tardiphaga sp. 42S5]|jgi:hypothetical protein|uniref:hypothetical protein n=1 Tax=Tardiphaga sp. 42S5 TaxID=1404799 RepID=UPI002A5A2D63|nr:hypothetical protein [Tardiphaga sp. 42S5]WPO44279.1 hypothetical protein SFY93_14480 [Tardiphaga sp. 42S5]